VGEKTEKAEVAGISEKERKRLLQQGRTEEAVQILREGGNLGETVEGLLKTGGRDLHLLVRQAALPLETIEGLGQTESELVERYGPGNYREVVLEWGKKRLEIDERGRPYSTPTVE
jgi:hypothetical protein